MNKALIFLLLLAYNSSFSQTTGQLDLSFGDHGLSATDRWSFESLAAMALQPDGKIVAAGFVEENNKSSILVLRYLPEGSVDSTFGNMGAFEFSIQPTVNAATAITIQPDGKILVAGYFLVEPAAPSLEDIFILRLTDQGLLDNTFNGDGIQTFGLLNHERAERIKLGMDGKLYVAGNTFRGNTSQMLVIRYNMDGSIDPTFGSSGRVLLSNSGSNWSYCNDMLLQPDGKIVIGGELYSTFSGSSFSLMRLHPDGSLDNSFNGDGKVSTNFGIKDDVAITIALQANGMIVAGGYTVNNTGSTNFALARYTTDGNLDNSFGAGGQVVTLAEGGFGTFSAICITPEGNIMAAGSAKNPCFMHDWVLCKFNQQGMLQTDFGEQGFLLTDYAENIDGVNDALLLPDGKLLVAGSGADPHNSISDALIARYTILGQVGTSNLVDALAGVKIFPNPTHDNQVSLLFTLMESSDVAIDLFSINGAPIGSMLHKFFPVGQYAESIELPNSLAKGAYLLSVRSAKGREFVKLIIQ